MKKLQMLQNEEYKILKEIDCFCSNNNIKYSLYAGTLLGAIRHQGFIPWDDDVDICMKRREFTKFDELMIDKGLDKKGFFYQSYKTQKFYPSEMTKVRTINISAFERVPKTQEKYYGAWVDIFPYDNVPDDENRRLKQYKTIQFYNKLLFYSLLIIEDEKGSSLKNKFKKLLRIFNEKMFKLYFFVPYILKRRHKVMTKFNDMETTHSVCLSYMFHEDYDSFCKELILNKDFKELKKAQFNESEFPIFINFDEILTNAYGDYTVLPKKEDRENHHINYN